MLLGSLCCSAAIFLVLSGIDPFSTNKAGFVLFYASFFGSIVGWCSIFFTLLDQFIRFQVPLYKIVQLSFLRALVIGTMAVFLLILQSQAWLSPLLFAGVIILLVIIEYILSNSIRRSSSYSV
jgi:hypothetical protein